MTDRPSFVPDPPIGRHGVIGDRRTAALVAADGTINWLCFPVYDAPPAFGALLDPDRGGAWRMGPEVPAFGRQRYLDASANLVTTWMSEAGDLELTDTMAWPWDNRTPSDGDGDRRVVLRRLRCVRGEVAAVLEIVPRYDFRAGTSLSRVPGGLAFDLGGYRLGFWVSRQVNASEGRVQATFRLTEGEEVWAVLDLGGHPADWSVELARDAMAEAVRYWHDWIGKLDVSAAGKRAERVGRSALTVHLLSYAPTGSPVAAPITSLPERVGGGRNWGYRYAWVRDASLSLTMLIRLGETTASRRYMDCLTTYRSSTESPLQIVYGVGGELDLPEHKRTDLAAYRRSLPVRTGNRACGQRQLDSLGFFAECALAYLQGGGHWQDGYWEMVLRAADYTADHWTEPDNGIWELLTEQHFVSSKVMSWVCLDRAARIAQEIGHRAEAARWRETMEVIHTDVMEHGWSERLVAFRQRYEADTLDASALLIGIMGLLPPEHSRVLATADRIAETLAIDGFVHRYLPGELPEQEEATRPLGEFEGAFLPCTFWLVTTYARAGRLAEAERILARAEANAGELGLFAEEVDARSGQFLGNHPLLFSQVEYVRAVLELEAARRHA
ncbi:MAG: glycoside hydrolase family 15 protein [Chloroflexota bacterium]|nr:glycoside hydrolase family 15 protein [Chloroflexota bacterium]